MLPFQHILSQLGYALISSLWQMAVLSGVYVILTSVFPLSAAARFRWAALVNFTGIVWFFITFFIPVKEPILLFPLPDFSNESTTQTMVGFLLYALSCSYLIWLGFSFILLGVKWKRFENKHIIFNQKVPARWRLFVEQHSSFLGIRHHVRMHMSFNLSPATFGWIKPIILLPASCLTQLTTRQMEALLLHELAHIRRYDYLVHWILNIAEKLLYFNPFMRKMVNEARIECEHACDDLVLQFNYPAVEYSGALLAIAKKSFQLTPALQATGNHSHLLYNRICRMLKVPISAHKTSSKTILTFFALPLLAIMIALPRPSNKIIPVQKETGSLVYWKKTPVSKHELKWQRTLFDARMNLFAAAIGRIEKPVTALNTARIKQNKAEMEKMVALKRQSESNAQKMDLEMEANREQGSMVLSASWVQQQEETNNDVEQLPSLGWKPMQMLLDKLETERKLNGEEWEKLAGLITVHNEIRMAIIKDANRNAEEWVTEAAVTKVETNTADEVLIIVYDENTGTLAASVIPRNQLNMNVQLENNLTPDERQVILLRRKAEGKSKIISL